MIKKISLIISLLTVSATGFAQNWGGGVDDDDLHFGFGFQYISAEYKILKKPDWRTPYIDSQSPYNQVTDSLNSISSPPSVGFGLGFVVNKRLGENFDIRATPTLIFSDRLVLYNYDVAATLNPTTTNSTTPPFKASIEKKVQATMFEFPLGLKIKSNRLNNFRAYWLGGMKYSIDIASKKKTFDEGESAINKLLKNKRSYLSYETAIGCDFYFEYFKMSPEIKISYSLNDLLKHDNTAFANPIDKMMLRHFTFSLFFE